MAAYREPAAGELDRRLAIRRRIDLPADDMGLDSLFSVLKARWGKIQPVGTAVYAEGHASHLVQDRKRHYRRP
jgi:hypothetical protein